MTNSQLLTTKPKKKDPEQTKQTTRTGRETEMEITWRVISGGVGGERGGKGTENK